MKKCNVKECKARCCYSVPMEKGYFTAFKKKIVNPILELEPFSLEGGKMVVVPITNYDTAENKCPFLTENYRCNIYDKRPRLCREYGETNVKSSRCEYLTGEKLDVEKLKEGLVHLVETNPRLGARLLGVPLE